ncbi:MAG: DMT family transporter [candidate division Zixibacteria bacterium]|nr:DMT family transporter [candidate division Zixibacteria bacterium]
MTAARVFLLLCVVFWGWTFVATKIVLEYLNIFEIFGLRLLLALPVLFIIIRVKKLRFDFTRKEKNQLIIGGLIMTAHLFLQILGLKYTSATNTGWIVGVTPLVMALMSYLILREKLGWRGVFGITISTTGIVFLMSRGNLLNLDWLTSVGDWLVLATSHTWALYTIAVRDVVRRKDPLVVTFAVLLPSAVVMFGYMCCGSSWSKLFLLPLEPMLALIFLGVLGLAVGHWFWQEGVKRIGAARAGIFLYLMPVATTALAVPYLHESFGLFTALGGLLVLTGVWYSERKPAKSRSVR